jgi:hypothetical protein
LKTLPVHAAENVGCNTNRDLVLKQATTNDCPEEEAEAKAITCTSSGMADVKETKRLAALVKLCMAKPKKGAGGGSAAKAETKPAAATEEAGAASGKYQCRGVDKDGKVIVENASDKTSVDCLSELGASYSQSFQRSSIFFNSAVSSARSAGSGGRTGPAARPTRSIITFITVTS